MYPGQISKHETIIEGVKGGGGVCFRVSVFNFVILLNGKICQDFPLKR